MRTDAVVRPLTPMERAMWMTDRAYPLSVVVALRTRPALPRPAVRRALDALQRRYALLRVRIREDTRPAFVEDPDPAPIPLETGEPESETRWLAACAEQLNTRLASDRAPLVQAALLRSADEAASTLLLSAHHTVVDGHVLARLARGLLALCANDADPTALSDLPLPLAHPERLRPSFTAKARFLGRELRSEWTYRRGRRPCPPPPVRPDGVCRADALRLTREETRAFVRACRRAEVTVHGALLAALALELRDRSCPEVAVPFRMISFADLRPGLAPADRDAAGAHVAMLRHTPTPAPNTDLWALARTCDTLVAEAVRRGDHRAGAALAPAAMRQTLRAGRDRMGDAALSYLGPVDLPARFGAFTLEDVYAFISSNPLAPPLSGFAHLFDHRLHLGLMTLTGDFDDAAADALVRNLRSRLLGGAL